MFIYTGIGGEWRGLKYSADNYYKETNLADVLIMGNGFTGEQEKAVLDIDGVTATERRSIIKASGKSSSIVAFEHSPTLSLHFVEKNEIAKFHLVTGIPFTIQDENGIWSDKRFADANNLRVGDTLTLNISYTALF